MAAPPARQHKMRKPNRGCNAVEASDRTARAGPDPRAKAKLLRVKARYCQDRMSTEFRDDRHEMTRREAGVPRMSPVHLRRNSEKGLASCTSSDTNRWIGSS